MLEGTPDVNVAHARGLCDSLLCGGFRMRLNGVEPSRPLRGTRPSIRKCPAWQSRFRIPEPNRVRLTPVETGRFSGALAHRWRISSLGSTA
jgi:hypothetical protein